VPSILFESRGNNRIEDSDFRLKRLHRVISRLGLQKAFVKEHNNFVQKKEGQVRPELLA
jgi:hypothetical protein